MATQISPRDFCQWFKGVLDITNGDINPNVIPMIKQKLDLVFTHEDQPEDKSEAKPEAPRC